MSVSQRKKITVGFDARLSGKKHAGIGRYIENLLLQLIKQLPAFVELIIFFHDRQQEQAIRSAVDKKNIEHSNKYTAVFVPIRHYSVAEQVRWPKILQQHQLDLLHVPHFNIPLFYSGKIIATIHDLLWHERIGPGATTLPIWKYYLKYAAYRLVTHRVLTKAGKILVPTQAVKKTLGEYRPAIKQKIIVTYEGISRPFLKILQQLKADSNLAIKKPRTPSLIYVGSLYPHKNINLVLNALTALPEFKLTIVCARNVFMKRVADQVEKLNLSQQVEFTGYLEDQKLIKRLQTSFALVQPSKSEGFGLTAIEAMAVGTPVLASDLPVFREVYHDAPLYFDPDDSGQLLAQIQHLKNEAVQKKCINRGLQVADQYRWSKTAKITLQEYLNLVATD